MPTPFLPLPSQQNSSPIPPTPASATIAASGSWVSGPLPTAAGYGVAAAATLSQAGTLTVQRYMDPGATIALGPAISQAMTANVQATVYVNDGLPASCWTATVANTSGSVGDLSGVFLLISAGG